MDNQGFGEYEEFCIDDLYFYEGLVIEKEVRDYVSSVVKEHKTNGKFSKF